jgi:cell division septation protein DedD
MKSELQALLNGTAGSAPAWNLTLQSKLYNSITSMFRAHSDSSDSAEATANGAVLLMLLSTVPVTGSLAVPLGDCTYQDINNVIDGGVSSINVDDRTVRLSVAAPGTFLSMFGTNIFLYTLEIAGVWQLTFASDWNSITAQTYLSELLPSRIYLGNTNSTPIPPPGPVPTPTPTPSPTPSPSPTPTPAPTKTLSPTKSPVSTPSPSPTPTPQTKPSNPTQTPTATPQPKNYVLPVTVAFAGLFLAFSISVSAYLRRKQALNVGKPPQSG